jgi:hypothetical protein
MEPGSPGVRHWVFKRLAVYAGVAATSGIAFTAAAAIYSQFVTDHPVPDHRAPATPSAVERSGPPPSPISASAPNTPERWRKHPLFRPQQYLVPQAAVTAFADQASQQAASEETERRLGEFAAAAAQVRDDDQRLNAQREKLRRVREEMARLAQERSRLAIADHPPRPSELPMTDPSLWPGGVPLPRPRPKSAH